jgi:hypothetical protein
MKNRTPDPDHSESTTIETLSWYFTRTNELKAAQQGGRNDSEIFGITAAERSRLVSF